FTAPLINAAATIAFLVYGESKAEPVHHILKGDSNIEAYPAQLIAPADGTLYWFMDEAAARTVKQWFLDCGIDLRNETHPVLENRCNRVRTPLDLVRFLSCETLIHGFVK